MDCSSYYRTKSNLWLSDERVGFMTWWFDFETRLRQNFFPALTSAEACEKSHRWFWKEICLSTVV